LAAGAQEYRVPLATFDRPLQVVAGEAAMIVVARVDSVGPVESVKVSVEGLPAPIVRYYCPCQAQVLEVIKSPSEAAATKPAEGQVVSFLAVATPKGGPGNYQAVVAQDARCVLSLRRQPGLNGWVLPFGRQNYPPADKTNISAMIAAARLDDWPWGPAEKGLQMAAIPRTPKFSHSIAGRTTVSFATYVAVRNAADKPLTVNLSLAEAVMEFEARSASGQVVRGDPLSGIAQRLKAAKPQPAETLSPGQARFCHPTGNDAVQLQAEMDLPAGEWDVIVRLSNQKATEPEKTPLWTGQAVSAPVKITVVGGPGSK
jgi:hypothetical protein